MVVIVTNANIVYLKVVKRVALQSLQHKGKKEKN